MGIRLLVQLVRDHCANGDGSPCHPDAHAATDRSVAFAFASGREYEVRIVAARISSDDRLVRKPGLPGSLTATLRDRHNVQVRSQKVRRQLVMHHARLHGHIPGLWHGIIMIQSTGHSACRVQVSQIRRSELQCSWQQDIDEYIDAWGLGDDEGWPHTAPVRARACVCICVQCVLRRMIFICAVLV